MTETPKSPTRTIWRGLEVVHPADWEVAVASGPAKPPRFTLADRYFQRFDIRWRAVDYRPDMNQLLEPYRRHEDDLERLRVRPDSPPGWVAVERRPSQGLIVQAARHFEAPGWLAEATLVWPDGEDAALGRAILESIRPAWSAGEAVRRWQAMGLRMQTPASFDLQAWQAHVGQVEWRFATNDYPPDILTVRRLAMPQLWLKSPLDEWMAGALPAGSRILERAAPAVGQHRAARIASIARADTLLGRWTAHQLRMDWAWECPLEKRVYQVTRSCKVAARRARAGIPGGFSWPEGLRVLCCDAVW